MWCFLYEYAFSIFPLSYGRSIGFLSLLLLFLLFLFLLIFPFSLVYYSLSLSYIACRTYHGVRCLYSYIDYLSLCIHLPQFLLFLLLRTDSIPTNTHPPSPACSYQPFSSLSIYLFLDMCRGVSHLLTSYINFPIPPFLSTRTH